MVHAGQADKGCAAVDKRDDGEHESGYRHSRVIFLRRRLISGRHRCPLVLHIDGGAGVSDGRLVSSSTS